MSQCYMSIRSKMNGMALTISDGQHNTTIGDVIAISYTASLKQKWLFQITQSPVQCYMIKNGINKNVLDIQGSSKTIYSNIVCKKPKKSQTQLWCLKKYKNYSQIFSIQNIKSQQVLQIYGGIDAQGMNIVQNKFYGNLNQLWYITINQ